MTISRSFHLILNKKHLDDRRYVRDFIGADFSVRDIFLLYFWNGLHPQTLTFFLAIMLIWEKHYIFPALMIPLLQYMTYIYDLYA